MTVAFFLSLLEIRIKTATLVVFSKKIYYMHKKRESKKLFDYKVFE